MTGVHEVVELLEGLEPARLDFEYTSTFGLLVTLLLAIQGTEKRAEVVAAELLAVYPDPAAVAASEQTNLLDIIRTLPLANRKAAGLKAVADQLVDAHNGLVPTALAELLSLPGVGPKTAGIVAGELGDTSTFPVERHAERVIQRLGFEVDDFAASIPKSARYSSALRLTLHGRRRCTSRQPGCERCGLAALCPSKGVS